MPVRSRSDLAGWAHAVARWGYVELESPYSRRVLVLADRDVEREPVLLIARGLARRRLKNERVGRADLEQAWRLAGETATKVRAALRLTEVCASSGADKLVRRWIGRASESATTELSRGEIALCEAKLSDQYPRAARDAFAYAARALSQDSLLAEVFAGMLEAASEAGEVEVAAHHVVSALNNLARTLAGCKTEEREYVSDAVDCNRATSRPRRAEAARLVGTCPEWSSGNSPDGRVQGGFLRASSWPRGESGWGATSYARRTRYDRSFGDPFRREALCCSRALAGSSRSHPTWQGPSLKDGASRPRRCELRLRESWPAR